MSQIIANGIGAAALTGAEIKSGYEGQPDTNALTDLRADLVDRVPVFVADVAALLADTEISGTAGDIIRTRAEGFAYEVAASGATDHHVTTAGGVKLYVLAGADGYNVKAFGATGDGSTDDTDAIQKAVNAARNIWVPEGVYVITDTIREATNTGALKITGAHRKRTTFLAAGINKPVVWVGNSNGHGNYRHDFSNFTVDCGDKTPGSVGIILQEAGTGNLRDVDIRGADVACKAVGVIGSAFGGKCEWSGCNNGLIFSTPVSGTPSGIDDLTTTAFISLRSNINTVRDIWFSEITQTSVHLTGGLTHVTGCTFQSCGGSLSHDVIVLDNANEATDYGGGPIIHGNWIEGGFYRYAIAMRNTRAARITDNVIYGSSSDSPTNNAKEGGILKDAASTATIIKGNSIRGFFVSPPTETRLANGAIYTEGTLRREQVFDNYIVRTQVEPYFEGLTSPTKMRGHDQYEIVLTNMAAPVVTYDSHGIVSSVVRNGAGDYSVIFNFNREVLAAYVVTLHARTGSALAAFSASCFGAGNPSNERIIVENGAGDPADPFSLTIVMRPHWQGL